MGLKYMLMFPAKLKVIHAGKTHFSTSQEAWDCATESPLLKCNPVPPWRSAGASSDADKARALREEGRSKRRHSGSRRNRAATSDQIGNASCRDRVVGLV